MLLITFVNKLKNNYSEIVLVNTSNSVILTNINYMPDTTFDVVNNNCIQILISIPIVIKNTKQINNLMKNSKEILPKNQKKN